MSTCPHTYPRGAKELPQYLQYTSSNTTPDDAGKHGSAAKHEKICISREFGHAAAMYAELAFIDCGMMKDYKKKQIQLYELFSLTAALFLQQSDDKNHFGTEGDSQGNEYSQQDPWEGGTRYKLRLTAQEDDIRPRAQLDGIACNKFKSPVLGLCTLGLPRFTTRSRPSLHF